MDILLYLFAVWDPACQFRQGKAGSKGGKTCSLSRCLVTVRLCDCATSTECSADSSSRVIGCLAEFDVQGLDVFLLMFTPNRSTPYSRHAINRVIPHRNYHHYLLPLPPRNNVTNRP